MASLSMGLRERIVGAYAEGGVSHAAVGRRYGVSASLVGKLVRQQRDEGSLEPRTYRRGRKRSVAGETEEALRQHLRRPPDATLEERREALGLSCALKTVWLSVRRLKGRFKNSPTAPPNRTARTSPGPAGTGSTARRASTRSG